MKVQLATEQKKADIAQSMEGIAAGAYTTPPTGILVFSVWEAQPNNTHMPPFNSVALPRRSFLYMAPASTIWI